MVPTDQTADYSTGLLHKECPRASIPLADANPAQTRLTPDGVVAVHHPNHDITMMSIKRGHHPNLSSQFGTDTMPHPPSFLLAHKGPAHHPFESHGFT